jgi:hypothetical protein
MRLSMRTRILSAVLVLLVVAAVWWWPTDRRRIAAASGELAEAMSIPPSEPDLARVARVARLSRLLAPDFRLVNSPGGRAIVESRDATIGLAAKLRPPRGVQVTVGDLDLEIDGATARARTVVTLREPGANGSTESTQSRMVALGWTKDDTWTLSEVSIEGEE